MTAWDHPQLIPGASEHTFNLYDRWAVLMLWETKKCSYWRQTGKHGYHIVTGCTTRTKAAITKCNKNINRVYTFILIYLLHL